MQFNLPQVIFCNAFRYLLCKYLYSTHKKIIHKNNHLKTKTSYEELRKITYGRLLDDRQYVHVLL